MAKRQPASRPSPTPKTCTVPITRHGVLVGSLTVDLEQLRRTLGDFKRAHDDLDPVPDADTLAARLYCRARGLAEWYAQDLLQQLRFPAAGEEPTLRDVDTPQPAEALDEAQRHANWRDNTAAGLAALRLLSDLGQPAAEVLEDLPGVIGPQDRRRPRGAGARTAGQLTTAEVMALARVTGDPQARRAVRRYFDAHAHRGAPKLDWTRILDAYDAVRVALSDPAVRRFLAGAADAPAAYADQATLAELKATVEQRGLGMDLRRSRPPIRDLSAEIVAAWCGAAASSILVRAKRRESRR